MRHTFLLPSVMMLLILAGTEPADAQLSLSFSVGGSQWSVEHYVREISEAYDPSDTLTAFEEGLRYHPNSVKLHEAYLQRMIDFGIPSAGYTQAQSLVRLDDENGLGWAVIAHAEAEVGNAMQGFEAIVLAVKHAHKDHFVQRTAAWILFWYDSNRDHPGIPKSMRKSLEKIRDKLEGREEFDDAYREAKLHHESQVSEISWEKTYRPTTLWSISLQIPYYSHYQHNRHRYYPSFRQYLRGPFRRDDNYNKHTPPVIHHPPVQHPRTVIIRRPPNPVIIRQAPKHLRGVILGRFGIRSRTESKVPRREDTKTRKTILRNNPTRTDDRSKSRKAPTSKRAGALGSPVRGTGHTLPTRAGRTSHATRTGQNGISISGGLQLRSGSRKR